MKITNPITLDVARSNSYICLLAKQFDENSRFLIATLTNNGEPMIIPAGAAVTLRATRPDGEPVAVPGIINNDGTTTVEIDDYILEVVGSASLSIEVAIGDEILTSASFNLTIQRADGNGWLRVYVAAASLAAGNYYITIGDTPYAFTTTQAIPAGGSVYFASEGGTAQTRDASGNVLDASLTLTAGTSGTELTSDVPTMSFLTAIAGRMATIEAEMSQKANIDGSYPLLNAGSADNLMADTGATQAIPFIQEGTGKGNGEATVKAGGVLQLKKKLGNTVAVNQLCPALESGNWASEAGVTASYSNGVLTYSTATGNNGIYSSSVQSAPPAGHKYLIAFTGSATASAYLRVGFPSATGVLTQTAVTTTKTRYSAIFTSNGATGNTRIYLYSANTGVTFTIEGIEIRDLTLWFGSNDRIPSDLLSHPENWGRYYAGSLDYNAGTLESADGTVMRSIGRNLFNKATVINGKYVDDADGVIRNSPTLSATDWIEVVPNSSYFRKTSDIYNGWGAWYDRNQNYISGFGSGQFSYTAPSNAAYCRFTVATALLDEVCWSLYYSGESGYDQYYPYSVLAEVDTGSEVLRSAGAVADEKTPDGTITRRVGVVDLGTLNWTTLSNTRFETSVPISGMKYYSANTLPNIICGKYETVKFTTIYNTSTDKCISVYDGGAYIQARDTSYSTAAAFKTAMSGVYLYYELATPTTEQGTAFAENIPCDPDGTLSWTQTKGIPQGNEIFYPADLKGALDSIVAALPSANGTYTLHATVTTAGVTFSWS